MIKASRRICLAGIAAVLLLLVAACGSSSRDVRRGADLAEGVGLSRVEIQALDYWFPATGAQATTGAQYFGLVSSLRDGPLASCMASDGASYTNYSAAQYAATFVLNADLPDLAVISRTGKFVPDTPAVHIPNPNMAGARVRAYNSDLQACQSRIVSASHPDPDEHATALRDQWAAVMSSAESSTEVRATLPAFGACIERAGVPASVLANATSSSAAAFGAVEAWTDGPTSRARTTAMQDAVERHWATVFVRCARPVVAQLAPMLKTKQQSFFEQQDQQLRQLTQNAVTYVSWLRSQHGTTRSTPTPHASSGSGRGPSRSQ
jgi:hypothetical protein